MAYPKIASNGTAGSASRKLDRPVLTNKNFFQVKLTDSESGKENVYAVVIIESRGDAGSSISINDIHIKDADGVNMSTHEVNGSRSNSTIQDAYFTLSPLQKISAGWTANVPFLGVVKANFNTEKVKTAAWTAGGGDNDLPVAVRNEIGNGPLSYVKINLKNSLQEVDTISDAATPFTDAEHIIPIYNHSYIETNPIPKGQYAAILIRGDVTSGMFDGIKENKLYISHNSTGLSSGIQSDYNITLKLSAQNDFVFGSSFAGVDFTDVTSHDSSTFFRTIKHIATDADTGTSWHARDTTNPLAIAVYNPEDGLLYSNSNYTLLVPFGSSYFTTALYHTGTTFQNDDIETAWNANGYIFEEAELIVGDNSILPTDFDFSGTSSSSFYRLSENPIPETGNPIKVSDSKGFIFKHTSLADSNVYKTSNIDAEEVTDRDGTTSSLYPNFAFDTKITAEATIFAKQSDVITEKTLNVNYLVYPQFTYGTKSITNYGKEVNLYANPEKAVRNIVHKNDNYTTIITEANKYCPIVGSTAFYSASGLQSIITKHNVRINVLNAEDQIGNHALNVTDGYYKGDGRVEAYEAIDPDAVLEDTSGAETLLVPNLTDKKVDYTIRIQSDVPETPYSGFNPDTMTQHLLRNADGSYKNMDKNGGFYSKEENFVAPITNWQPGFRHGQTWGTNRIPYYHSIYATGKSYKNLGAFYVLRPFLQLSAKTKDFEFGMELIKRLEFIAAPNLNPTAADVQSGIVNYSPSGTTTHLENSKELTFSTTTGVTDRITNLDNDAGFKSPSQIPGAEVFGLSEYFGTDRLFVGPDGYQDVVGGKGFTKLIKEDGTAAVCILESTAAEIRAQFGKPTHASNVKRENFAFTSGIASSKIRSRIYRPYGYDLTCSINRDIADVVIGDVFVPTAVDADDTIPSGSHDGGTTVVGELYTATSAGISGATVDILDLDPKERGITLNGQTEIDSARFNNSVSTHAEHFGANVVCYYKSIDADFVKNSKYVTQFGFDLFNLGIEDVLIKSAVLFDPMYLPEGEYTINPEAAQTPTWSLQNVTHEEITSLSNASNLFGNSNIIDWVGGNLNTPNLGLSSVFRTKRAPSAAVSQDWYEGSSNTSLEVKFEVSQTAAAGKYFKVLEIEYYRDEGITQNKNTASGFVPRNLTERRVWTTRVLLKVEVEQSSKIEISDTDGTVVQQDGLFDFGTIIG